MTEDPYLVGIDGGTESVRVGIFDREGTPLVFSSPDIKEAAKNMVRTERTIEPDQEKHEEYKFYVDKYVETYPQMKDLMYETVRHVAG